MLRRNETIMEAGYNLVECWEYEMPIPFRYAGLPRKQNETFPNAIVYDFEAYQDPGGGLVFENEHVSVSVSLADTFDREPEHIVAKDPKEVIRKSWEALVRREEVLRERIRQEYMPEDFELLPKKQQAIMRDWCNQIPEVGFNSGAYDLNMIKKYFATHIRTEKSVAVAKKQGKIMFMSTENFKFLDISNYSSPGTSYEKWVKTYGTTQPKSWLPYEWFTNAEKLDYDGLPLYRNWFSRLKNQFPLSLEEYGECKRVFRERGMKTFADWLKYYNNLDVGLFLEALEKMRGFYSDIGVDIFKDAGSLPGVSL